MRGAGLTMINNLEGMKFGDLEVIKCLDEEKSGKSLWECRCDCGKKCMVSSRDLKYGRKTSCGCQKGSRDIWKEENLGT